MLSLPRDNKGRPRKQKGRDRGLRIYYFRSGALRDRKYPYKDHDESNCSLQGDTLVLMSVSFQACWSSKCYFLGDFSKRARLISYRRVKCLCPLHLRFRSAAYYILILSSTFLNYYSVIF